MAALLEELAAVVLAVEALLEERHVERVGLLEQLRARRVLARRDVPHEVHDEVLVACAHVARVEEPAEVLAEGGRRLEVLLAPAQDHPLAADVLEDVQDARQVVERVRAPGGDDVDVRDHQVALGRAAASSSAASCMPWRIWQYSMMSATRWRTTGISLELERVHDQLREAHVHLGLGDDADERVPVLEARPHVVEVHAVQRARALGDDPLAGHEEVVEGDDRLDLLAARGQRVLVGVRAPGRCTTSRQNIRSPGESTGT